MSAFASWARVPSRRFELLAACAIAWACFVSVPVALGGIGLGWDALNHQVYLGWTAESARFDKDYAAANFQAYQFPYLYWPLYKLFQSGATGLVAGIVLCSLYVLAVPAVWFLSLLCIPERTWWGVGMRFLGTALAFLSAVVLAHFDSTGNDLMASIPLVWAIALALAPLDTERPVWATTTRLIAMSGALAGLSIALKLSNGPLVLVMPALWILHGSHFFARIGHVLAAGIATVAAFVAVYGWWGWQLWMHYGNPVFPFAAHIFEGPVP